MINDLMSIAPIKVWIFWIIIGNAAFYLAAYKAYKQLLADNLSLAKLIDILIKKEKTPCPNSTSAT